MANRDKQVDRAREALQQKEQDDRLRAEREESERAEEAAEARAPNEGEGDGEKRSHRPEPG